MIRRQNILILSILGCTMFFIVALFKAQSWSSIPYHPTDGLMMLQEVERRQHEDVGLAPRSFVNNFPMVQRSDKENVTLITYHFKRPILPPWLKWLKEKTSHKSESSVIECDFAFCSNEQSVSSRHDSLGGIVEAAEPKLQRERMRNFLALTKDLEPNTPFNLNEDFLVIQSMEQIRVYAASRISPKMTKVLREISIDPSVGLWDGFRSQE